MEYDFRAARDEITRTVRVYRALKAKGMLTPDHEASLKYRVFTLEREIAEARQQKMTAGHGSHLVERKINFSYPIIPELAQVIKV